MFLTRVNEFDTIEDAWNASSLNFEASIAPHMFFHPLTGEVVHNPKSNTVVTSEGLRIADHVGARYEIVQPRDWADPMIRLHKQGSICIESFGAFKGGREYFIQAKYNGEVEVSNNDPVQPYITLTGSNDGSRANKWGRTFTRIVCHNTFAVAHNELHNALRHSGDVRMKLEEVESAINHMWSTETKSFINKAARLSQTPISSGEFGLLLDELWPLPAKDARQGKTLNIRNKITDLFSNGRGNSGQTMWDAFNAVTEFTNHHASSKGGEEGRFHSVILGQSKRKNNQAWGTLVDMSLSV